MSVFCSSCEGRKHIPFRPTAWPDVSPSSPARAGRLDQSSAQALIWTTSAQAPKFRIPDHGAMNSNDVGPPTIGEKAGAEGGAEDCSDEKTPNGGATLLLAGGGGLPPRGGNGIDDVVKKKADFAVWKIMGLACRLAAPELNLCCSSKVCYGLPILLLCMFIRTPHV